MKRSGPLKRKAALARTAMKRARPVASTAEYRNRSRAFRMAAEKQGRCAGCGTADGVWHAHHVCYRQHVRQEGGDIWATANALRLCDGCHGSHHTQANPLPLTAVPFVAIQWARELLGTDRADEYLTRRYR